MCSILDPNNPAEIAQPKRLVLYVKKHVHNTTKSNNRVSLSKHFNPSVMMKNDISVLLPSFVHLVPVYQEIQTKTHRKAKMKKSTL